MTLPRWLTKLICRWFGHDWFTDLDRKQIYTYCKRCGISLDEALNAKG
jgi:hypothetical protein